MCKMTEDVACCCLKCAFGIIVTVICALMLVFLVVALLVWYFKYYDGEHNPKDVEAEIKTHLEDDMKFFF